MDALRNLKKNLLTVTVLFLFVFFNLILDAPRILQIFSVLAEIFGRNGGIFIVFCDGTSIRNEFEFGFVTVTYVSNTITASNGNEVTSTILFASVTAAM
jgi:hypothetical protein